MLSDFFRPFRAVGWVPFFGTQKIRKDARKKNPGDRGCVYVLQLSPVYSSWRKQQKTRKHFTSGNRAETFQVFSLLTKERKNAGRHFAGGHCPSVKQPEFVSGG